MISAREILMIQELAGRGENISSISALMHRDRKTVRKVIEEPSKEKKERESKSILDAHKPFILAQLERADFTAQRLFQDIKERGYSGKYDVVKKFVAPLKAEKHREAVMRFETEPGQQAQVDWGGRFGLIEVDGVKKILSCFSMVLGYSRKQYIEFRTSRDLRSFLECHSNAFEYLGGVPHECLYDNLKTAVLSHVDNMVEWQNDFLDFCRYHGFVPRACRPYRAQTKGKVERPFQYVRSNFFMGRDFRDVVDLNGQSMGWLEGTANCRIHGTTNERPCDRFEKERGYLKNLPEQRYVVMDITTRSSTKDFMISYGGNFYSVPPRYASTRDLRVQASSHEMEVYHGEELITTHELSQGKGQRIVKPEHMAQLEEKKAFTKTQLRIIELRALGPEIQKFVDGLVETQTKWLGWHLKELDELIFKMGLPVVQEAVKRANSYRAYDSRTLETLCQKLRWHVGTVQRLSEILPDVLGGLDRTHVEIRDLREYEEVFCGADAVQNLDRGEEVLA